MSKTAIGIIVLAIIGATCLVLLGTYNLGSKSGANDIQKKWDAQKLVDSAALLKKVKEYDDREKTNRAEIATLSGNLAKAKSDHVAALAAARADYANRLQQSKTRAAFYERLAKDGSPECRSLASHATRLDTTLEGGRDLVRRLGDTIRLRDAQLILLGNQIQADRKLFSEPDTK